MNRNTHQPLSIYVTKFIISLFFSILATLTVLTHIAQILQITFKIYAYIGTALTVISIATFYILFTKTFSNSPKDRKALVFVLCLGLVGAVLALITHKPDSDDYYYIPNVIYYLDHPHAPMNYNIHFLYSGLQPFTSLTWGTALPFDYARSIIAYIANLDYLSVYYLHSVAIVGFFIPLSLYYLISRFTDNTLDAAIGTVFSIGALLVLRETHRTFGNFAFPRAFQGKTLLLSIGIPVYAAVSIDFLFNRSFKFWIWLFITSVAMIGATTTTLIIFPPLALLIALSFIAISETKKSAFYTVLPYFLSLAYILLYAAMLKLLANTDLSGTSVINEGWPTNFFGHINFFIRKKQPITPLVVVATTGLTILMTSGKRRKFLAIWMLGSVILFLNPLVAHILIKYITTPNIYWRMFYLYPFPLIAGIVASTISEKSRKYRKISDNLRIGFAGLGLGIFLIVYALSFIFLPGYLDIPHYKLPSQPLKISKEIIRVAPPGPMLAPSPICGIIPLLSSKHPQMRVRSTGIQLWLGEQGRADLARVRINASIFASGESDEYFDDFNTLLETTQVRSIVLESSIIKDPQVDKTLKRYGYINAKTVGEYTLMWK